MTRDVEFPANVLDRVIERQHGQCGGCGDQLTSDYSDDPVIPAVSFANSTDGQAFLKSDDNCIVVCQECHDDIDDVSRQTGSVPPPEIYPHSHGSDLAAHQEWSTRINNRWDQIQTEQPSFAPSFAPKDPELVPEVKHSTESTDEDPIRKRREKDGYTIITDTIRKQRETQAEWSAEVRLPSDVPESISNPPPAHGVNDLSGLLVPAGILWGVAKKRLQKTHVWQQGEELWKEFQLNREAKRWEQEFIRCKDRGQHQHVQSGGEASPGEASSPASTSPETISNQSPAQTNEPSDPTRNFESPAAKATHSGPEEDTGRVQPGLTPGPVAEFAQDAASPLPRDTWKSLDNEVGFAPNFRTGTSISNESPARHEFPSEKLLRPWSEDDTASVKWILSQVHDEQSAAVAVKALKELGSQVDFRPETNGYHVLYARDVNHKIAEEFTQAVAGFKTLDQSDAGRAMNEIYQIDHFTREQRKEISGTLSDRFVRDARGPLVVFDTGYPTYTEYLEGSKYQKFGQSQVDANFEQQSLVHNVEFIAAGENLSIDRMVFNPPRETWKTLGNDVGFIRPPGRGGGSPPPPPPSGGNGGSPPPPGDSKFGVKKRSSSVLVPNASRRSVTKNGDESLIMTAPPAPMAPALESSKPVIPATLVSVGDRHEAIRQTPELETTPQRKSLSTAQLENPVPKVEPGRQAAPESHAPLPSPAQKTSAERKMEATVAAKVEAPSAAPSKEVASPATKVEAGPQTATEVGSQTAGPSLKTSTTSNKELPQAQNREAEAPVSKQLVEAPASKSEATRKAQPEVGAHSPNPAQKTSTEVKVEPAKPQAKATEVSSFKQVVTPESKAEPARIAQAEVSVQEANPAQKTSTETKAEAAKPKAKTTDASVSKPMLTPASKAEATRKTQPELTAPATSASQKREAATKAETANPLATTTETSESRQVVNSQSKVEVARKTEPEVRAPATNSAQKTAIETKAETVKPQAKTTETSASKQVVTSQSKSETTRKSQPEVSAPAKNSAQKTAAETKTETVKPQAKTTETSATKHVLTPTSKVEATRKTQPEVNAQATGSLQKNAPSSRMEAAKTPARATEAPTSKQVVTAQSKAATTRKTQAEVSAQSTGSSQKNTPATKMDGAKAQTRVTEASTSRKGETAASKVEGGRQAAGPAVRNNQQNSGQKSAATATTTSVAQQKPANTVQTKSATPAKYQSGPAPAAKTSAPAKTPVTRLPVAKSVPTPSPRPIQQQPAPRIQTPPPAPARPAPSIPPPRPSLPAVRPTPPAPSVRPSGGGKGMG